MTSEVSIAGADLPRRVAELERAERRSSKTPASYQSYLVRKSYSGYQIDYRPLGQNWFVLSGEGNGRILYEKVMFSCSGRLINSFALLYSANAREGFDRIVERMEKSFRPGQKCEQVGLEAVPKSRAARPTAAFSGNYERSAVADRIARARGRDVLVVLRRTSWPYEYKIVRGFAVHELRPLTRVRFGEDWAEGHCPSFDSHHVAPSGASPVVW